MSASSIYFSWNSTKDVTPNQKETSDALRWFNLDLLDIAYSEFLEQLY